MKKSTLPKGFNLQRALTRAMQFYRGGRLDDAEKVCKQILKFTPKEANASGILGAINLKQGKPDVALKWFKKAVKSAPHQARSHHGMGEALAVQCKTDLAVNAFRRAIALDPTRAESHFQLGQMFSKQGLEEQALESYLAATRHQPDFHMAHLNHGRKLMILGRMEEGVAAIQRALDLDPKNGPAYLALGLSRVHQFSDLEIATMGALAEDPTLNTEPKISICFALSEALERRENYDQAFYFLQRGNRLYFNRVNYDRERLEVATTRMIELMNNELVAKHCNSGDPSFAPIFVLGLPRSGTTLIEQILASHSQVTGAGETDLILAMMKDLNQKSEDDSLFVKRFVNSNAKRIRSLGQDYLNKTRRFTTDTPRFVDKSLNFRFVGQIHLMLPNAKFIHCRRHPVDNCLSCFKQYFVNGHNYSYDLVELGHMYRQYDRLMRHWHDLIPDRIIDVQYETLVSDQEATTHRMLEFLDLPWEESCLEFHKTTRSVSTISAGQVRQPVYKSAVDRWRRYEKHLGPLLDVLRQPPSLVDDDTNKLAT